MLWARPLLGEDNREPEILKFSRGGLWNITKKGEMENSKEEES